MAVSRAGIDIGLSGLLAKNISQVFWDIYSKACRGIGYLWISWTSHYMNLLGILGLGSQDPGSQGIIHLPDYIGLMHAAQFLSCPRLASCVLGISVAVLDHSVHVMIENNVMANQTLINNCK